MIVTKSPAFGASPKATPIGTRQGHVGTAVEIGKRLAEYSGVYKDIRPYLPDTYVKKYTYKPRKRVAGYLGQKLHAKKSPKGYGKLGKARSGFYRGINNNFRCQPGGKSGNCTQQYS